MNSIRSALNAGGEWDAPKPLRRQAAASDPRYAADAGAIEAPFRDGRVLAHEGPVVPVRVISGKLCVEALERAGFTVEHTAEGITVLGRGYRAVVVPMLDEMPSASINNVLNAAGICYGDFVLLLEGQTLAEIGRTRSGMRPRSIPPGEPIDEG